VPGGLYHVILRGNAQQDVFLSQADRGFFYRLLSDGVARFGYRVHAFCLMTNHVHLAMQAGDHPLSRGMQNISFRYTRYLNDRLNRSGHVFEGRYKAYLVDQDQYGLQLVRYIHLNPVRARLARDPGSYAYSSYPAYLGHQDLPWLTTDWVLGQFGNRAGDARRRFTAFVEDGGGRRDSAVFYGGEADSRVVGEEDFLKKVLHPGETPPKPVLLAAVIRYVCKEFNLPPETLKMPGRARHPAQARALIAWLAIQLRSCTLTEVADHFSRSPSTFSHLVASLEKLALQSPETAQSLNRHLHAIMQA
jgi:REP element-mobilizing transposase RayT